MTTIIVTHEDNEIDEFAFEADDRVVSIGRRSTNDVCIPNLSVSGMHARITIDGETVSIEDNNSTNGTYVNGRLISRQLLNIDDEIVIGKTRLIVQLNSDQNSDRTEHPFVQSESQVFSAESDYEEQGYEEGYEEDYEESYADGYEEDDYEEEEDYAQGDYVEDDIEADDSFMGDTKHKSPLAGPIDNHPLSLSEKAKHALSGQNRIDRNGSRVGLNGVEKSTVGIVSTNNPNPTTNGAFLDDDIAVAEAPRINDSRSRMHAVVQKQSTPAANSVDPHPLDGLDEQLDKQIEDQLNDNASSSNISSKTDLTDGEMTANTPIRKTSGAVIEIQNGAKSGQVLPIDKPVTTLGRPGIQIAAIMRKPDGYFLMHIESDDCVDMPTLNRDSIGDDPVMLHSGDRLNVAGIDVEFMLS